EEDRAFERRPHPGDREQERGLAAAVLGDVLEGEVVADERRLHGDYTQHGAGEDHPRVAAADGEQRAVAAPETEGERERAQQRAEQPDSDTCRAERSAHGCGCSTGEDGTVVTRSGFLAMYSSLCLTMMRSLTKSSPSNRPSSTTGMPGLNSSGGPPWCCTWTRAPLLSMSNRVPPPTSCTVPPTTAPSIRKRRSPSWLRWASA